MTARTATVLDFDRIYSEMEKSFIPDEIREKDEAFKVLSKKEYIIYIFKENGEDVGFITIWELDNFAFAEHFVIFENYRNSGYGSRAIKLLQEKYPAIILEVEHPEDELKARRIVFYKRLGFLQNDYPYIQPSYRKGGEGVPLILMSYPNALDNCEKAVKDIYSSVYNILL